MNDVEFDDRQRTHSPLDRVFLALDGIASYDLLASRELPDSYFDTNAATEDEEVGRHALGNYRAWRDNVVMGVFDVPNRDRGDDSSSIGSLGRPVHASAERLKGVYRGIIDDERSLVRALDEFADGASQLNGETYTRVQYRAIVDGAILRRYARQLGEYVEATVPLDSGHLGREPVFIYLAYNHPSRGVNRGDRSDVQENVDRSRLERHRPLSSLLVPSDNRYSVDTLSDQERQDESVLDQVAMLYERFGWERGAVREMLRNPNNIFAVARRDGRIISSGIAEMAVVDLGERQLRIAELTEAATLQEHERNGCFTAISTNILLELRRRSQEDGILGGEIDLIFAESNGLSRGILYVARHQGRAFAAESGGQYGYSHNGILRQQVRIEGPVNSHTRYNDLVVTYFTRSALYRLR